MINSNNNRINFGALRVPTDLSTKAGQKANDVCWRILKEFRPGGISSSGEYHSMFFHNKYEEAMAENILHDEGVYYSKNNLVDSLDTFVKQEWAKTGKLDINM